MRVKHRVTVLIAMQIALIITSFLTIVYFESQTSLAGNVVNVAGKNRLLTSMVLVELNHVLFHNQTDDGVHDSLRILSENISLLKTGGIISQIEIPPLPEQFGEDWNAIQEKFLQYEAKVSYMASQATKSYPDIEDVEQSNTELTILSDVLTEKLGRNVDILSAQLMALQTALGAVNVAAHIITISLIWRILDRHTQERIKAEKLSTIGEFAVAMAHNLRNPLGAMKSSMRRIHTHNKGIKVIEYEADRADRCITRMSHQIEDVINYVRTVPLSLKDESVQDMLKRSLSIVEIPENVSLEIPENNAHIQCDRMKMEVVFANLLRNAIEAIGDGPGCIIVKLATDYSHVQIEFENSGPPISKSDLPRIFEPLYTTKIRGTGLGLASCMNIVERHDGSITVHNNPVTFTIHLSSSKDVRT